ncbi:hypothetical protein [Fulvimonas yonginensis]|uniref:DUF4412 domain-containing protein n=1 Tax=Fulvimonas yonginensis TaxID=1495200 RepID=A0ABU8JAM6_9GAMM
MAPTAPAPTARRSLRLATMAVALLACGSAFAGHADRGGTLNYTIVLHGHAEQGDPHGPHFREGTVDQRIEAHWHLDATGQVSVKTDAGRLMAHANRMQALMGADRGELVAAMQACGDDEACATAAAMRMADRMSPAQRAALAEEGRHPVAGKVVERTQWYYRDGECTVNATVADTDAFKDVDIGEGYATPVSGNGWRRGERHLGCRPALTDSRLVPRLDVDYDGHAYRLRLPMLSIPVTVKDSQGTHASTVEIAPIALDPQPFHGGGFSGRKVIAYRVLDRMPAHAMDLRIPVQADVRWSFQPDAP